MIGSPVGCYYPQKKPAVKGETAAIEEVAKLGGINQEWGKSFHLANHVSCLTDGVL